MNTVSPEKIGKIANRLRSLCIRSTTLAGSGHPTSCCSAADLVATLFFGQMRFDPRNPKNPCNDRFVLSKGHAAPLLYAAWAETGHFSETELDHLRKLDSDLEGHPTPRLDFVDVATGSLGMGISFGAGMGLHAKMRGIPAKTYVLLGDGEMAEGNVWEAVSFAGKRTLTDLTAIVDVNGLGQSQETPLGFDLEAYRARFESFGWEAVTIDGHSIPEILRALAQVEESRKPFAILAKTIKGKGIPSIENKNGWHGKILDPEFAKRAIQELEKNAASGRDVQIPRPLPVFLEVPSRALGYPDPVYPNHEPVSTRKAFGNALVRIAPSVPDLLVFDGDVENSTYTDEFQRTFPDRFIECYIGEQNMVAVAVGLSSMGKISLCSTFAAFFARALDQIRMAGISRSNLKLVGTHSGVSIGEDGPSQMGLEDIAMMRAIPESTVVCPADAVSCERLMEKVLEHQGICYVRTARPNTPILYRPDEKFEIGGAKILRQSGQDIMTVVATGVTVFEALEAWEKLALEGIHVTVIDAYSIKPLAKDLILSAVGQASSIHLLSVEDHYMEGGLGDALAGELSSEGIQVHKLAVNEIPHSGNQKELLSKYRIDSSSIIENIREIIKAITRKRNQAA